jgi:hypothetical protein
MEVQVEWKNKGRSKEYGVLAVPVDEEIEVRLFWNGYNARPAAYIFKDKDGVLRLHVSVKRDIKKPNK